MVSDAEPNQPMPLQRNGGSRPVPDPTIQTDKAIDKSEKSIHEWVDGQLATRDERLRGIDEATKLRLGGLVDIEKRFDDALAASVRLTDQKFEGVAVQFRERDTRSEREARDNKVAVDAAFAAQKEAAAKQDEANAKAIDKSERNTADTITKNQALSEATTKALSDGLSEVKERVTRIESAKLGAKEDRTGLYAVVGIVAVILGSLVGIAGLVLALTRGGA